MKCLDNVTQAFFWGAAKATWQLLAGIPKSSSQLERIKSSVTSNEILYPTVGQHQTATCTTEHHQACASQRWSHKHPCVFSHMC